MKKNSEQSVSSTAAPRYHARMAAARAKRRFRYAAAVLVASHFLIGFISGLLGWIDVALWILTLMPLSLFVHALAHAPRPFASAGNGQQEVGHG
ncbi:MAG: hypothetical protein LBJ15_18330 [Comamonas sp.]|jgi:hypothetical protein|uniref:hypothetical protein n=1 Tax=Comamonas sp. TaxID=34028 RepID=UPI00282A2A3B|nr:hypothetical protein [Comamonas sp.]MDR0215935.1 hypothetical protein [Comamonas sp.]